MKHDIIKHRHELKRRSLRVQRTTLLTPQMLRLTLAGDELAGFISLSPDDHIKVFAPALDGEQRRDYTPRRYDAVNQALDIDFALHDGGPVTSWARRAKPGDPAQIGGPRGSTVVPQDFDWWLLIGDETALPAIGRRIEELSPGTPVSSLVAVAGPQEQQVFESRAQHQAHWVHRPASQADDAEPLLAALQQLHRPAGEGFIWIAAEGRVARRLRTHVLDAWQHPRPWVKAAGYWVKGQADSSDKMDT